jgi:hypothetical protein
MIEDNQTPEEESNVEPPKAAFQPSSGLKKILYGTVTLLLMGAAFMGGRYSVQMKSPVSNPFAQVPTPMPVIPSAPVPESALVMINFTGVSESKKAEVLSAFNIQPCQCNCKMSVAACIIKDPNCPFWKDHVTQLQLALGNGKKPDLSKAPKSMMTMPQMMSLPPGSPNGSSFPQGTGK